MSNHQDSNLSFCPSNWFFSKLKCKQNCIYCNKYLISTKGGFGIKIYCSENPEFKMFECKYAKRIKRKAFLIRRKHGFDYIRKVKWKNK